MKVVLGKLVDLLFISERSCVCCGLAFKPSDQGFLCENCLSEIKAIALLERERPQWISQVGVFAPYEGVLKEAIRLIKFEGIKPLAHALGEKISKHLKTFIENFSPDIVTPVPIHIRRWWVRGFDHNVEILKGAKVDFQEVLVRVKHSKPLAQKGVEERKKLLKDAFKVKSKFLDLIEGKRILIFDDILTTGTTASVVASTLMEAGAREVGLYCVAQA